MSQLRGGNQFNKTRQGVEPNIIARTDHPFDVRLDQISLLPVAEPLATDRSNLGRPPVWNHHVIVGVTHLKLHLPVSISE
jgi:hypothetical protein